MEPEGLLLHSEMPNIESYPESAKSNPHIQFFPKIHVNSILLSKHISSKEFFYCGSPTKIIYA